ncbi:MAG: hypothetical protein GW779_04635 [Candidatus Altiarchaeum hamiconexum]|uniref:Uncharacterized protein n=1 Tax=Candidatus Altarchaeum hamiconexum TaxID=1803513 RepID=A0A8J8CE97_9ARCH|nr:hypothetical protein [Candidatus Altarchaeum hamiconexum]OIQ04661.1 MAG: hypothetical protein AUK59_06840 [Candidatus Altarchaeum sp. CG2_30_32_3053]PIN67659.1 MAG: hypothetical protein COV98_02060 [Candidatus Altarchaeum sp. CG12_big_fil_rev_8_21_14_0_65_33_22]PIV28173.1 MAG: hypothetical protein COS36_03095 [Candidatus Altarchaeum sp. CG03_land_8_20_14_0_80_32_618]PIX48375.1 MAG: hypothetical protein COZ53_04230 [Candidatus Altarchaeum sp. CG_4_8_14_3_um_filter_33_2054]PIZ32681.1 MAG: hyp
MEGNERIGQNITIRNSTSLVLSLIFLFFLIVLVGYVGVSKTKDANIIFSLLFLCAVIFIMVLEFSLFRDRKKFESLEEDVEICNKYILSNDKKDICILSGEAYSGFYEEMKENIENIIENNGKIRFLCGPEFDINSITLLELAKEKKIEIRLLKKREERHFKVADDKYFCISDPHGSGSDKRSGWIEHSPFRAIKYKTKFENLWKKANVFDVENVLKDEKSFQKESLGKFVKFEKGEKKYANEEDIKNLKIKLSIKNGN